MHTHSGMAAPRRLAALIVVFLFSFAPAIGQQDNLETAMVERQAETATDPADKVEPAPESIAIQRSDLAAQEKMAEATEAINEATQSMMLAAWISVIIGAGGLTALIWTFREQRKLFRADNQAYIEVIDVDAFVHPTYGMTFKIDVANRGKTPARNLKYKGKFTYRLSETEKVEHELDGGLAMLPPGTTRTISGRCGDMLHSFGDLLDIEQAGSHGKWTWRTMHGNQDESLKPYISLEGWIRYSDAYEDNIGLHVWDRAELVRDGNPLWLGRRYRKTKD